MRLLLAEDEKELNRALVHMLKHEHYEVDSVFDGEDALDYALSAEYEVMIFDVMMPKRDGISVLKEIRKQGIHTPVLLLTAKSQVDDRITGLDAGADDYLCKPFDRGELFARLRALARRKSEIQEEGLHFHDLSLDQKSASIMGPKGSVQLTNKEFQLLELFMKNQGIFFSSETLLERIWGFDSESSIAVVWTHISFLRKRFEAIGSEVVIVANRGIGYRLGTKND